MPEEFQTLQTSLQKKKIEFDAEGNVKVKKLEAEEGKVNKFRLNTEGTLPQCSEENEGEMFYSKEDKHFYGCNGTKWEILNSPSDSE